jgi:hypothetical protein
MASFVEATFTIVLLRDAVLAPIPKVPPIEVIQEKYMMVCLEVLVF